jgi:hypothetical protein
MTDDRAARITTTALDNGIRRVAILGSAMHVMSI